MNTIEEKPCKFSFIYVCEELHPTVYSCAQTGMCDAHTEWPGNTNSASFAREHAEVIADSLKQFTEVKTEDATRYESVFIRPEGVVKCNMPF